jgi:hypothetical protein
VLGTGTCVALIAIGGYDGPPVAPEQRRVYQDERPL